jgi:hypothetical protein
MFDARQILLAAVALTALAMPTLASAENEATNEPSSMQGRPQVFAVGASRVDVGSEQYPSVISQGADAPGSVNRVTRWAVPAYQGGFDVGSEAYPAPR